MQLTSRQKTILQIFLEQSTPITAKELAKRLGVSTRTIRYDIDDLEFWLNSKDVKLLRKPKIGLWLELSESQSKTIREHISTNNPYTMVLSQEERVFYILLELLKFDVCTSDSISEKLGVSRATIIKDLKEVKKHLESNGLKLVSRQGVGYKVQGPEDGIRRIMVKTLLYFEDTQNLLNLLSNFGEELIFSNDHLKEVFTSVNVQEIKKAIKFSKRIYDFWIPDSSYVSLVVHVLIALYRLLKGLNIEIPQERIELVKGNKEYLIAKEIGTVLSKKYHIEIPDSEIANITIHLLSANLKLEGVDEKGLNELHKIDMDSIVTEMLQSIQSDIVLPMNCIENLKKDLVSHLKLTMKKYRLNIYTENPFLDQIKKSYYYLYQLAERMMEVYKLRTNVELTENEIGYIALYLAVYKEKGLHKGKKKALVVCTTGKGSAQILSTKIQNNITDLEILAVISIFELEDNNHLIEESDLIISTISVNVPNKPVFRVNPFITNSELNLIRNNIYHGSKISLDKPEIAPESFPKATANKDEEKTQNNFGFHSSKNSEQLAEQTAYVLSEIANFTQQINSEICNMNIWGITIHLTLAIPRWKNSEFNKEINAQDYINNNKDKYEATKEVFDKIGQKLNMSLPESEVIALMRYIF